MMRLRNLCQKAFKKDTSSSTNRLQGKVALITGGAGGIGRAVAELFTHEGAHVVVADISSRSEKTTSASASLEYVQCDVSQEEQVKAAVDRTVQWHGRLDIMLNNAGTVDFGALKSPSICDMEISDLRQVLEVNLVGCALGVKHAARVMAAQRSGSIICTASVAGVLAGMAPYGYTVSKHAIVGLVKNAAADLGRYGVRVNSISPFGVPTDMAVRFSKIRRNHGEEEEKDEPVLTEKDFAEAEQATCALANLKGVSLSAIDVAQAALFLGSDESRYVSGHNLLVDGGFTVVNHSMHLYSSN